MSTDNVLKQSADEYLRKHRIVELMEDLCSDLCYDQPQNINDYLVERLKNKQKQGKYSNTQDSRLVFLVKKKLPISLPFSILKKKDPSINRDAKKH